VERQHTIADVKKKIESMTQIPPQCQKLMMGARVVDDAEQLVAQIHTGDTEVRMMLMFSLDRLTRQLEHRDPETRIDAVTMLAQLREVGGEYARAAVVGRLQDKHEEVRRRAVDALVEAAEAGDEEAGVALQTSLAQGLGHTVCQQLLATSVAAMDRRQVVVRTESLLTENSPVQRRVEGVLAARLGLGDSASQNLALRSALHKPGAPFGGIGFFKWAEELEEKVPDSEHAEVHSFNAEAARSPLVMELKMQEFKRCADGDPSIYFWVLHPIFNNDDRLVGAEVLLRAKNGTNTCPFEDVRDLMDPAAPPKIKDLYAKWKGVEIVAWPMQALKDFPVLRRLQFISVNVRPWDLCTTSLTFHEVTRHLSELHDEDRQLLVSMVSIEICEDQEDPPDMETSLVAWDELGFRLAFDDTISKLTCQALGKPPDNFHTTQRLEPLMKHIWLVKVDMDWAGHLLFLCHPSLGQTGTRKAEVLRRARDEGLVYVAQGPASLRNTGVKHADVLAEFVAWAQHVILLGKKICFELTVRRDDPNCALAIEGLRELDMDIFGKHAAHFCFQGGVCGPRAFLPSQLAGHCM